MCAFFIFELSCYILAVQHERAPRCYQYKHESPELLGGYPSADTKPPQMALHTPLPPAVLLDRAHYQYAHLHQYR